MTGLPTLMVAPNGARLTKADHPALPLTIEETVTCAAACQKAGANGLHLHIRDAQARHLLDAKTYRDALAALAQSLPDLPVQITTEAVGMYDVAAQKTVALTSGASMVSASIRELTRAENAAAFYEECAAQGIAIQHILYDAADAELLARTLPDNLLGAPDLQLLFVLGRYSKTQNSSPDELAPFLTWQSELGLSPDWATCAFGVSETACLVASAAQGGKVRVGFENARHHADGTIASSNAERVRAVKKAIADARI